MKGQNMRAIEALLFILAIRQGYDALIIRASSDPVKALEGSDAVLQWILNKDLTSRPDFQGLVFGLWRNGYIATYILTVTKAKRIISNPSLKDEAPHLDGRVQWKGDLSKSVAAFQISHVSAEDQMEYGLMIDFGALKESKTSFVSLQIQARSSITAALSPPLSVASGGNTSFYCEFYIDEVDKSLYDTVTVGLWELGSVYRTLSTLTKHGNIVMNPKLHQEAPGYHGRVHTSYISNKTSNTSVISVVLADVEVSDTRSYGCSMDFGPFKEPVGTYVKIEVEGSYHALERRNLMYKSQRQLVSVRGGSNVSIPCPELAKVIQEDGTFKWLAWYYRDPETCSTEWCWLAGLNGSRVTLVTPKGRYANRTNLIQNGTLELYNVQMTDATNYKCKVKRINFTSPAFHHVTIRVDSSVGPKIKIRSPSKVTISVANTLFLKCKAEGVPRPLVIWKKDSRVLQSRANDTNFVHENATKDDAGNYECIASNSAGSDSYRIEVIIAEVFIKGEDLKDKSNTWNDITIAATVGCIVFALIVIGLLSYICYNKKRKSRRDTRRGTLEPIDTNDDIEMLDKKKPAQLLS